MTFHLRGCRAAWVLWVICGLLTIAARAQEPRSLRHFGVESYWSSVQSFSWTFALVLPWLLGAWSRELGSSVLSRDARLQPWKAIATNTASTGGVTLFFCSAYLLFSLLCDRLFGAPLAWKAAFTILTEVAWIPLPIAALLPALAERVPNLVRLLVGCALAFTLVALLGGGALGRVATLASGTSSMDRVAFRAGAALVLLTLCSAALAHFTLTRRRAR